MSNYILDSPIDIKSTTVTGQLNLYIANSGLFNGIKAPTLTSNVDFTLPSISGSAGQYIQKTGPTSSTWANISSTPSSIPITFLLSDSLITNPVNISSTTLTTVARIYWRGSDIEGVPGFAIFCGGNLVGPSNIGVRMMDITNSVIVGDGTISGTIVTGNRILNLTGTISTSPAIWEFQLSTSNVSRAVVAYSLTIY